MNRASLFYSLIATMWMRRGSKPRTVNFFITGLKNILFVVVFGLKPEEKNVECLNISPGMPTKHT